MYKLFEKFFNCIDIYLNWVDNMFLNKSKKKTKKKCKNCHCDCHCKDQFHSHHYDGDLCACGGCKH